MITKNVSQLKSISFLDKLNLHALFDNVVHLQHFLCQKSFIESVCKKQITALSDCCYRLMGIAEVVVTVNTVGLITSA